MNALLAIIFIVFAVLAIIVHCLLFFGRHGVLTGTDDET